MSKQENRSAELRATNPLFGDRKLKLGIFCSNLSGGCAISTMEGVLQPDWGSATELGKMADQMEFEAIVPVGRWRGFGGETDFNGSGFESYTFAAGMGAQHKYPAVFATSHVPTIHPVMAAKQATTVDHISGGRFGLNLVTGWHKTEIEIFGAPMLEHDARYDCAAEWLEVIKLLWQSDVPIDFDGKYYQVKQALLKPRPIQRPYPPVMCAGQSSKGREFAAKYCDMTFMFFESRDDVASMQAEVERFRKPAREETGRELGVWTYAYIIQGDTEEQARQLFNYCVHEKGDWTAVNNVMDAMGVSNQSLTPEVRQKYKEDFIAGFGGFPLIGTKEQVVDGLKRLSASGIDGVLLTWPAYIGGMRQFQSETLPLLVQEGLR